MRDLTAKEQRSEGRCDCRFALDEESNRVPGQAETLPRDGCKRRRKGSEEGSRDGVCVSVVDIVTDRQANLYAELLAGIDQADPRLGDPPPVVYAVTLRRRKPKKKPPRLDVWFFPLAVGQPLPVIPLWLGPDLRIELPLEPSYEETCRLLHIK